MTATKSDFSSKTLDSKGGKKRPTKTKLNAKSKKVPKNKPIAKKKIKPKKMVRKKKTAIKKPVLKKKVISSNNEINEQLSNIYKDTTGNIPNMKKIRVKKGHPIIKFFFSLLVIAGLLAAIAWAGFFVLPNNNKFSEDKVKLSIDGPKNIKLGATSTYVISYANNQSTRLNNVVLTLQYPKGFAFSSSNPKAVNSGNTEWNLGSIAPNEKRNITIVGLTYGEVDKAESWRAFLSYKPDKFNYKAQKVDTLTVQLKKSPVSLSISGPDKATIGNDVEYTFKIKNINGDKLANLKLSPSWSSSFIISTTSYKMDKNKNLIIKTTTSTETTLKIQGRFASTTGKRADIEAKLYVSIPNTTNEYQIASKKLTTTLEENNLKLDLTINGNLSKFSSQPGGSLVYSVYLKNNSHDDMNDVKVELAIDAPSANNKSVMDWLNIVDKYDGNIVGTQLSPTMRRGEIKWDKKYIPSLKTLIPNDSVSIDVTLPTRDINKFNLTSLKSYEIEVIANTSYKNKAGQTKQLSSNPIKIIINSDLKLQVRDTKSVKSGKDVHNIKWILTNNFHELKDITVDAEVYGKASYKLEGKEAAGKATYDSKSQKLSWKIDRLPLVLDTYTLPFSITVDKKNDTQKVLVTKVKLQATDTVTKETIKLEGNEIKL